MIGPLAGHGQTTTGASTVKTLLRTEEGRMLLQQRTTLFALVGGAITAFFYVFAIGISVFQLGRTLIESVLLQNHLFHLFALLFWAGVFLYTRSGSRRVGVLLALDVALVFVTLSALAGMVLHAAHWPIAVKGLALMLITTHVLVLRAAVIPSSPLQTLLVGAVGAIPVMVAGAYMQRLSPAAGGFQAATGMIHLAPWALAAIAITVVASQVIYGLRREVAEAKQLGQYLLDEKIGEGGMGAVYRARHALLRRPTAVKLLPPEQAGDVNMGRFEREVQLTSQLTHPNTVAIFDYGRTPDGVFYYAMEYLDGLDLDRLVEEDGPQPASRVAHVLEQVCGALEEAHGVGLIHRDIKPANIILCERGGIRDVAKVVDFGLVKQLDDKNPALSNVDTMVGTPLYMSPEAIRSPDRVDVRSDLYGLGAVAYFLLTGEPPFLGSMMEVCAGHLHETPPLPSKRAGRAIPSTLERLVMSCLAKDPAQRPESASALAQALIECGLPVWTRENARDWWDQRRAVNSGGTRVVTSKSGARSMALTIDFARRAAGS